MKDASAYQKLKLLLYGSPVLLLLCYVLAVQPSVKLYKENRSMKRQLQQAEDSPRRIATQQAKLGALNQRLGIASEGAKETSQDQEVLEVVTDYCSANRIKLSFPAQKIHAQGGYKMATDVISVEGDFHKALKLAYELEVNQSAGRISCLKFERRKDRRTKRYALHTDIYLQNLKDSSDEE